MTELIDIADETQRLIETSRQLTQKSAELERAARQLREANTRLTALDAQKDEFLSQVSHELRTPMTSIRSLSEILLEDDTSPGDRTRFAGIIHGESQRLTRLLDEILDISRLEAGTMDVALEAVDAAQAIQAALDSVSGMTQAKNVRVHLPDIPDGTKVQANDDRLRQVLINLLTNAVKYNADPAPEIRLTAHIGDDVLDIDVIDNGGGVPRAEAAVVFEKFARGSSAGRNQGAGLGLPISRAIMRTMGGDLSVEFTADNTSFFRARVPLAEGAR